jgi:hypothetical protein
VSGDLRTVLAQLSDEQPPVDADLDRQIAEGRRRVRRRNVLGSLAGVVVLGLFSGLVASLVFQTADGTPQSAGEPTPSESSQLRPLVRGQRVSTARSQALAAQLAQAAPEITRDRGAKLSDAERLNHDGTPAGWLWAGVHWEYPADVGTTSVDLTVEVAIGGGRVPGVCDGMYAPPERRCSEVRTLGDGSKAFILDRAALGGHQYGVRVVRPNGAQVFVFSGAQRPKGSTHDAVIGRARVVEIAQKITVTP